MIPEAHCFLRQGHACIDVTRVLGCRPPESITDFVSEEVISPDQIGEYKNELQCAGLNRHEVENERVSRERSSDPLGLESCVATVRDPTKRRQRIGGVGIQLRKDAIRTPTSL